PGTLRRQHHSHRTNGTLVRRAPSRSPWLREWPARKSARALRWRRRARHQALFQAHRLSLFAPAAGCINVTGQLGAGRRRTVLREFEPRFNLRLDFRTKRDDGRRIEQAALQQFVLEPHDRVARTPFVDLLAGAIAVAVALRMAAQAVGFA